MALYASAAAHAADNAADDDDLASVLAQPVYGSSRFAGASKYDQDAAETPSMAYVRTGGEIRAQGYRTLADVLESMPGIHLRYDRSYTYVGVRGVSRPGDYASRLLVLIDGVRVNEAIYDSATLGREFPLDIGLIDRVEFIPGPGSSLYGSNAVLGVVNVITRGPSQLAGAAATVELGSALSRKGAGTWGGDIGPVRLLLGLASERRPGRDLYFAEYDSAATNNGVAVGADDERSSKFFLKAQWADFTLSTAVSDRLKRDPTAGFGVVFNERSESRDRLAMADLSYRTAFDGQHEVYARVGAAYYRYDGYGLYAYGTPLDPIPAVSVGSASWFSGELRYVWQGWPGHRVLLGAEFQNNVRQTLYSADLDPAPHVYTDQQLRSSRYSLFLNDEWLLLPGLRLNLGLRSDRLLAGGTKTTPRVAAVWSPLPALTFKLQRGSAYREPNANEAHYTDGVSARNDTLKVESMASTEATVLWRPVAGLDMSATVYRLDMRDLINFVTASDGRQQYQNTARARSQGAELEVTHTTPGGTQIRASWAVQRVTDSDSGEVLSDSPRGLGKLMLTVPGPWAGSRLGVNVIGVGTRRSVIGTDVAGYVRANTNLTLAPPGQPWSVGLAVYNLEGRRYADPGGPEHAEASLGQDGRAVQLRFGLAF